MKIEIEVDGIAFVRWRHKAGHFEDGQFVVDDEPGQAPTGKWGVTHMAMGDGKALDGREIPWYAEEVDPSMGNFCAQCLVKARH